MGLRVAISHKVIVPPSLVADASVCPTGLKTRLHAAPPWLIKGKPVGLSVAISHSVIEPSKLPTASVCPSGLKAMLDSAPELEAVICFIRLPVVASHNQSVSPP